MIGQEDETEFRLLNQRYARHHNWNWIPRPDNEVFEQLWTKILNDEDVRRFLERTLYIPWHRPAEPHGDFLISILDHLRGSPGAAPINFKFYPDVRLTEATIVSVTLEDPQDGEMCIVTYTYTAPRLVRVRTTVDCVYAGQGNQWHPGGTIPCKFQESHPSNHRLKELTPDP